MNFINLLTQLEVPVYAQQFGVADWVWIIVFILALILVWWLLTRSAKRSESEAEDLSAQITEEQLAEVEEPQEEVEEAVQVVEEQEQVFEEAPPSEPDDLTRIEGIGPKINQLLLDAGISTYAQLADADVDLIDSKLDEAGITFAHPGTWPEQAKLASEGNWEELERLQDNLKHGRRE